MTGEIGNRTSTLLAIDVEAGVVALRSTLRPGENGDCYGSISFGVYDVDIVQQAGKDPKLDIGAALFTKDVSQRPSIMPYERRLKRAQNKALKVFGNLATSNSVELPT